MNNIIQMLQLNSDIDIEEQQLWKEASDGAIADGEVESLTPEGLFEVIDNLGYTVATETYVFVNSFPDKNKITEKDILESEADEINKLSTIHFIAALASGIHPSIIYDLVDLRVDYYTNQYVKKAGNNCD